MALSSLASFNLGASGGGAISGFFAAKAEGKARQQIADFNARIDDRNAIEAAQNAEFQAGLIENQAIGDKQFIQFQIDLAKAETRAELLDKAFRGHAARLLNRRDLATQRSKVAGSGVAIGGSALEVMAETAGLLEMGVLEMDRVSRIKIQGIERDIALLEREKTGLGETAKTETELTRRAGVIRSRDLKESGRITRAGGVIARQAGDIEANTSLLSGATRFSSDFIRFRKADII